MDNEKKIGKTEFVADVAEKTGLTKKDVQTVLDAALQEIQAQVAAGAKVSFIGFGSFKTVEHAAREGRNPATGQPMKIPASVAPKFTPGKEFKDAVNCPKKKGRCKAKAKK